jgi:protein TonB
MSAPIAYRKPKSGRLVLLFVISVGVHIGVAMFAIWAGNLWHHVQKPEDTLDLGMDVTLGDEVQELIVAQTPPAPPEPEPPPPEPEPPVPETPPEPMEKPDFIEPAPPPKTPPAPKPKVAVQPAPPGAKTGPTPRPGVVGGNVTEGHTRRTEDW